MWTNKIHHGSDLGEATTFPLIVFFVINHQSYIQMSFCLGTPKLGIPKFPKLGPPTLWKAIFSYAELWLRWGLNQSCSPHWELSKNMWLATYKHIFKGNSWLLMVGSQIGILTPDLFWGQNLCFKFSNGSCKPILDIYVLRNFQWYKKFFNPMNFDP